MVSCIGFHAPVLYFNLMEWVIEYLPDDCLLYIKTRGVVTSDAANKMVGEIVDAMKRYNCIRHIVDHRESVFAFKFIDYYDRPLINSQIGLITSWKIALVFKTLTEDTHFMETVFRNRGYDFREFDDLDKAKKWILK